MSPLQKIAMGMLIVVGNANFPSHPHPAWQQYDGLVDPLGWLLVLAGLVRLAKTDLRLDGARWSAILAALISVPLWIPQVRHQLDPSGEWALSLPQTAFCLLLVKEIAEQSATGHPDAYAAKRFGLLLWAYVLVAVLPVIAIGGSVHQLDSPTLIVAIATNAAFIFYLFRMHRRTWLGGPGPLLIGPDRTGKSDEDRPDLRDGPR